MNVPAYHFSFLQAFQESLFKKGLLLRVVLSFLVAFFAALSIVALFAAKKIVAVTIIGGVLFIVLFALSGNPRLFCLWGLMLSAPLALGKSFMPVPHMGGAAAYTIQMADLFLAAMVFFIARDFVWGLREKPRISWLSAYWLGLIAIGLSTFVLGPFRNIAGHQVFQMIKDLVLFWVIINEVVRVRQFLHVFGALFVGILGQSLIGLVQYIFKANLGLQVLGEATAKSIKYASKATYLDDGVFRIGALLGHPNLLAAYLALLLPMGCALLFSGIKGIYKVAVCVVIMLGSIVLVLTLSRSGWVCFAFAFVVLLGLSFLHPRLRRRYLMARLAVVVIVATFALAFSGPIIKRFTQSDPGAVNFRYEWIGVAWNMVKEKPLLGFGLNSFVFNMPQYTSYGGPNGITQKFGEDWPVVHNIYMLTWAEQGTLGLLLFLGLNIHVIYLAFKNAGVFKSDVLFVMNLGCISGFFAVMLDGLDSFFIRNPPCGRVFWIVIGLIVAIQYWLRENHPELQAAQPVESLPGK
jgi:O-antigen ligase